RPSLRLRTPAPSGSRESRASFCSIPCVGTRSAQGDSRACPSCRARKLVHFRARGGRVAGGRGVRAWFLPTRRAGGTAFDQPADPSSGQRERRENPRHGADKGGILSQPTPHAMTNETKHITVCVCTYKRPHYLKRLLGELGNQDTSGLFTYSIVVADNDHLQ